MAKKEKAKTALDRAFEKKQPSELEELVNALQVAVIELGRALETQTSVRLKPGSGGEDHKTALEERA